MSQIEVVKKVQAAIGFTCGDNRTTEVDAKCFLDWLTAEGYAVVPREPTDAMCAMAMCAPKSVTTLAATNPLDRQMGLSADIYRAMINAAEDR